MIPAGRGDAVPDAFTIDTKSYPKSRRYAVGHGYGMRAAPPTTGVIHTTNNRQAGTLFDKEAAFLLNSPDVSAHYLIGKQGRIVEFLDPAGFVAWHAGGRQDDGTWSALPAFANPASWGVELHVSVGEVPTRIQKDACAWLCRQLLIRFGMIPGQIETHRAIALPKGRKSDPEGWPNDDFYAWRALLIQPQLRRFRVRGVPVYQAQSLSGTLAGHLDKDEEIAIDRTYSNGGGHLASGLGFVDLNHDVLDEI